MKKDITNKILLCMITFMLVFIFVGTANAATYTSYAENFETEGNGNEPHSDAGEIPYVYAAAGYTGTNTDTVTDAIDGSSRLYLNASTSPTANCWANFTFNSSMTYDYFDFRFSYLNAYANMKNHSGIEFRLRGNVGDILFFRVYGANHSVVAQQNRLIIRDCNSVEQANVSLTQGQWYNVRINPDYDTWDNNLQITVYDVTAASYIIDHTLALNSNTELTKFYMVNTPDSASICILVDNLYAMHVSYTGGEHTTNYLAGYVIPILFALSMLMAVITLASGNTSPASLIMLLVALIVGMIALTIITSL